MPFFNNKFLPKKARPRKSTLPSKVDEPLEDLLHENHIIKLKLGDYEANFEEGNWIPVSGTGNSVYKSNKKLQHRIQEMEEENNMLKLKVEILLNMLTQATAETHLQQREIDKLQHNVQTQ